MRKGWSRQKPHFVLDMPRYKSRRGGGIAVAQMREGGWYFVGGPKSKVPNSLWDGRAYPTMEEAMIAAELEAEKVKQREKSA